MKVRPLRQTVERYARKSTVAYLEGEQSLNWIAGVLPKSGLSKEDTVRILLPLQNYGDSNRAQVLFDWLESRDW